MTRVSVETYEHEQTGKIHIVDVAFPPALWHCHCSLLRREEPEVREIELEDEQVCDTCEDAYREKEGLEERVRGEEQIEADASAGSVEEQAVQTDD